MPGLDGVAATREIHARCPGVTVLAYSSAEYPDVAAAFLAAGAIGYMDKADLDGLLTGKRAAVRAPSSRRPRRRPATCAQVRRIGPRETALKSRAEAPILIGNPTPSSRHAHIALESSPAGRRRRGQHVDDGLDRCRRPGRDRRIRHRGRAGSERSRPGHPRDHARRRAAPESAERARSRPARRRAGDARGLAGVIDPSGERRHYERPRYPASPHAAPPALADAAQPSRRQPPAGLRTARTKPGGPHGECPIRERPAGRQRHREPADAAARLGGRRDLGSRRRTRNGRARCGWRAAARLHGDRRVRPHASVEHCAFDARTGAFHGASAPPTGRSLQRARHEPVGERAQRAVARCAGRASGRGAWTAPRWRTRQGARPRRACRRAAGRRIEPAARTRERACRARPAVPRRPRSRSASITLKAAPYSSPEHHSYGSRPARSSPAAAPTPACEDPARSAAAPTSPAQSRR